MDEEEDYITLYGEVLECFRMVSKSCVVARQTAIWIWMIGQYRFLLEPVSKPKKIQLSGVDD